MLPDADLLAEVRRRVSSAQGGEGTTLSSQRDQALRYYRGDKLGNEVEGRSQVVSRDVAQYVDAQMPALLRIFTSGDEVARFEPMRPGDEERAQQATDYVNWIWNSQNEGFTVFHHWFKDGLLNRLGSVKIWWEEAEEVTREPYQGLTMAELEALKADPDLEVEDGDEGVIYDEAGQPVPVFGATVIRTNLTGRVRVEAVPPEEMLIGQRARSDQEADVLAHKGRRTRSDLIASGYDRATVAKLSAADRDDDEKTTRFQDLNDGGWADDGTGAEEEVEWIEAYLRLDRDGDGVSEMLRVCYSGGELLDVEVVDDHPFAFVSPILMPHRLIGMSTADQVMDIQVIKSTILRQILDNLYLTNMPQIGAVDGRVNLDDLLTRRPGGIVRMKEPGALVPIPTERLGQEPYAMIEYLDATGEQRTGATRYNQGLDADTLNKTATGINMIQNASQQRLELIARVYAETGVKRAFRLILKLVCKHQQQEKIIRLRGRWVPMDPREWDAGMDMSISVGLGTGNRDAQVGQMMQLIQMDQAIVQVQGGVNGPLLTLPNVHAKFKKLCELLGLKGSESYYTDPAQAQPPEPKPDPETVRAQAQMALEQQQAQHKFQLAQQAAEHDMQVAQWKAEQEMALERWKAEQAAQLESHKAQLRANLEVIQMQTATPRPAGMPAGV